MSNGINARTSIASILPDHEKYVRSSVEKPSSRTSAETMLTTSDAGDIKAPRKPSECSSGGSSSKSGTSASSRIAAGIDKVKAKIRGDTTTTTTPKTSKKVHRPARHDIGVHPADAQMSFWQLACDAKMSGR